MNQIGTTGLSIDRIAGEYLKQTPSVKQAGTGTVSFEQILQDTRLQGSDGQASGVTFSKHANDRLDQRHIELNEAQMKRLNEGVEQARSKNINESLVMLDDLAFIVNVKNNTVVTALEQDSDDGHVFTNIDGAVII
ncbi:MAG: flagellar protein [Lachnospiraceae bacterium]|nr:flagellar protein [Lachnospiraceae bacterium]